VPAGAPPTSGDDDLVARANRGDAAAFEELYRRHRDWVVSLAYRFTADRDDAVDVLQDTFSYLFGKFPGFELKSSLRTLLYPVVKHLSLDRKRRQQVSEPVDPDLIAVDAPEPGSGTALARALDELHEGQREVVLLRFVDDMSLEQIAAAVDVPVGTVKSRLHNAIQVLRQHLRRG